jgi:hypothetical protein
LHLLSQGVPTRLQMTRILLLSHHQLRNESCHVVLQVLRLLLYQVCLVQTKVLETLNRRVIYPNKFISLYLQGVRELLVIGIDVNIIVLILHERLVLLNNLLFLQANSPEGIFVGLLALNKL